MMRQQNFKRNYQEIVRNQFSSDLEFICQDGTAYAHQYLLGKHSHFLKKELFASLSVLNDVELIDPVIAGLKRKLKTKRAALPITILLPDFSIQTVNILLDLLYYGQSKSTGPCDPVTKELCLSHLYRELGITSEFGGLPDISELELVPLTTCHSVKYVSETNPVTNNNFQEVPNAVPVRSRNPSKESFQSRLHSQPLHGGAFMTIIKSENLDCKDENSEDAAKIDLKLVEPSISSSEDDDIQIIDMVDRSTKEESKRYALIESKEVSVAEINANFEDNEVSKEKTRLTANDTEVIELEDGDGFFMSDQETDSVLEPIEAKEGGSVEEPIEIMENASTSAEAMETLNIEVEETVHSILEQIDVKEASDCIDDLLDDDDEDDDSEENVQKDDEPNKDQNILSLVDEAVKEEGQHASEKSPKKIFKIKLVKQSSKEKEVKGEALKKVFKRKASYSSEENNAKKICKSPSISDHDENSNHSLRECYVMLPSPEEAMDSQSTLNIAGLINRLDEIDDEERKDEMENIEEPKEELIENSKEKTDERLDEIDDEDHKGKMEDIKEPKEDLNDNSKEKTEKRLDVIDIEDRKDEMEDIKEPKEDLNENSKEKTEENKSVDDEEIICPVDNCEERFKRQKDSNTYVQSSLKHFISTHLSKIYKDSVFHKRKSKNAYYCTYEGCSYANESKNSLLRHQAVIHNDLYVKIKKNAQEIVKNLALLAHVRQINNFLCKEWPGWTNCEEFLTEHFYNNINKQSDDASDVNNAAAVHVAIESMEMDVTNDVAIDVSEKEVEAPISNEGHLTNVSKVVMENMDDDINKNDNHINSNNDNVKFKSDEMNIESSSNEVAQNVEYICQHCSKFKYKDNIEELKDHVTNKHLDKYKELPLLEAGVKFYECDPFHQCRKLRKTKSKEIFLIHMKKDHKVIFRDLILVSKAWTDGVFTVEDFCIPKEIEEEKKVENYEIFTETVELHDELDEDKETPIDKPADNPIFSPIMSPKNAQVVLRESPSNLSTSSDFSLTSPEAETNKVDYESDDGILIEYENVGSSQKTAPVSKKRASPRDEAESCRVCDLPLSNAREVSKHVFLNHLQNSEKVWDGLFRIDSGNFECVQRNCAYKTKSELMMKLHFYNKHKRELKKNFDAKRIPWQNLLDFIQYSIPEQDVLEDEDEDDEIMEITQTAAVEGRDETTDVSEDRTTPFIPSSPIDIEIQNSGQDKEVEESFSPISPGSLDDQEVNEDGSNNEVENGKDSNANIDLSTTKEVSECVDNSIKEASEFVEGNDLDLPEAPPPPSIGEISIETKDNLDDQPQASTTMEQPSASTSMEQEHEALSCPNETRKQSRIDHRLQCTYMGCSEDFEDKNKLVDHYLSHHPHSTFSYILCLKSYPNKVDIVDSRIKMKLSSGTYELFVCKECYVSFMTPKELFKHKQFHKNKDYQSCDYCHNLIERKELESHMKHCRHKDERKKIANLSLKTLKCTHMRSGCNEMFEDKKAVHYHARNCEFRPKKTKFKCIFAACYKNFYYEQDYKRHIDVCEIGQRSAP